MENLSYYFAKYSDLWQFTVIVFLLSAQLFKKYAVKVISTKSDGLDHGVQVKNSIPYPILTLLDNVKEKVGDIVVVSEDQKKLIQECHNMRIELNKVKVKASQGKPGTKTIIPMNNIEDNGRFKVTKIGLLNIDDYNISTVIYNIKDTIDNEDHFVGIQKDGNIINLW